MQIESRRLHQCANARQQGGSPGGKVVSEHFHPTGSGRDEAKQHTDRGGFPGTIGTEKTYNLTPPDLQVELVDGYARAIKFR